MRNVVLAAMLILLASASHATPRLYAAGTGATFSSLYWVSENGVAGGSTWSPNQNHAFIAGIDAAPATVDSLTGGGLGDSFVTAGQPNGELFAGFAQPGRYVREGFTYSRSEGLVWLPRWQDFGDGIVNGMSGDGGRIVGSSGLQAVIWDESRNIIRLGDLRTPGPFIQQPWSFGYGISADGSVAVGQARNDFGQFEAFRWDQDSGIVGLGGLLNPGEVGAHSEADKISADGSTIVGWSNSVDGMVPFIWTEQAGMTAIGTLPGYEAISTSTHTQFDIDVSGDGSIVVGTGYAAEGAFIFSQTAGLQSLEDYLVGLGMELDGWHLETASGISENGRFIVGRGINPSGTSEGFIVVIPEPSTALLLAIGLAMMVRVPALGNLRNHRFSEDIFVTR